jgi:hypothetical protein
MKIHPYIPTKYYNTKNQILNIKKGVGKRWEV